MMDGAGADLRENMQTPQTAGRCLAGPSYFYTLCPQCQWPIKLHEAQTHGIAKITS